MNKEVQYNGVKDTTFNGAFQVGISKTANPASIAAADIKTVTVTAGVGAAVVFDGLTVGETYYIYEVDADGKPVGTSYEYTVTGSGTSKTISRTELNQTVDITNNKVETGSLKIKKNVTVNGVATTGTLADGTYTFTITGPGGYTSEQTIKITNGVSGEVQVDNLMPGTYTVSEDTSKNPDGMALVGQNNLEVEVTAASTATIRTAEFTNNLTTGNLKLSKVLLSDVEADKRVEFKFTVTLSDKITGRYGDMTFDNGVATPVVLKGGDSAEATGLPLGITYKIVEEDAPGFQLTGKTGDTGTISTTKSEAVFTNTPIKYCVAVTKKWEDSGREMLRPESINVTLKGTITKDGTEKVVYGPKTFVLTRENDWTALVRSLYMYAEGERIIYTWTEGDVNGYTLTANIPGKIAEAIEDTTAYITTLENTIDTGKLIVRKRIIVDNVENTENGDKTFFVQVTRREGLKDVYYANPDGKLSKKPVILTVKTGEPLVIENLPLGRYTVTEVDADGKAISADNPATDIGEMSYQFSVSATVRNVEVVSGAEATAEITNVYTAGRFCLAITKKWEDNHNQDGKRPKSITVRLERRTEGGEWTAVALKDDEFVKNGKITLSEKNDWMYMVLGQLQMDEQGNRYEYRWIEEFDDNTNYPEELRTYRITQENTDKGLTFVTTLTNVHVPEKTKIPVVKVWNDNNNQDGMRPGSVTVRLMKKVGDAAPAEVTRFTLAEADREINSTPWSHVFDNLPKNENGIEIRYIVEEVPVDGYSVRIAEEVFSMTDGRLNGFTVTNTHEPKQINVSVTKVWDDNDNALGVRPAYVRVVLTKNNVPITLNKAEYIKLPAAFAGSEAEMTNYVIVDGKAYYRGDNLLYTWDSVSKHYIVTLKGLPAYENGHEIVYGWIEDAIGNDYGMSAISTQEKIGASGNKELVTTITNKYAPGMFCLTVSKVWDDENDLDGIRPETVSVQLMADGEIAKYTDGGVVEPIILSKANNWTGMVLGVPKTKAGVAINYTWKEESVPGYQITSSVTNGLVDANIQSTRVASITNTHKPDLTASATVRKIWADNNDAAGMRPSSLTVTLYGNGYEVTKVILNSNNNWTASVGNLPASVGGEAITYTWREQEVLSYTQTGSVTANGLTTITNTYRTRESNIINNNTTNITNNYNTTTGGGTITRTVTVGGGGGNVVNGGGLVINNQANFQPNTPGEPLIEIDDYGTPLGIDVIINHVGDCFD